MPMVGHPIIVDGVVVGRACSRVSAKYCKCGRRASRLCDFELRGKKTGKTCDADLCERCALKVDGQPKDKDFCLVHARMLEAEGK